MMEFDKYEVLSFDCYGTLIDWESGILEGMSPVLRSRRIEMTSEEILKLFSEFEPAVEQGTYMKYRKVLQDIVRKFGTRLGFQPTEKDLNALTKSLPNWKPFPDTVDALARLDKKFKLAIISNIDDDLMAQTLEHLNTTFDFVITAEQIRVYKPSSIFLKYAHNRIGRPKENILHVAQSLFHDIAPTKKLGQACVWVNRRKGMEGSGATPPSDAVPDLEVPDLKALADLIPGI